MLECEQIMFDLMALALQTDSTRVATLFIAGLGQVFTLDGKTMRAGYHALSHHGNDPDMIRDLIRVETEHMRCLNRFLDQLKEKTDAEGRPLLDTTIVMFGTGMGDASRHSNRDLPTLVAGGGFQHGKHINNARKAIYLGMSTSASFGSWDWKPIHSQTPRAELTSGPEKLRNHSPSLPSPFDSAIELITLVLMTPLIFATSTQAQTATELTAPTALTAIQPTQQQFLSRYCTDCHERGNAENDVVLSDDSIDWTKPQSRQQWELVQSLIDKQIMPPTDSEQPSEKERAGFLSWLDTQLVEHSPIGGTPLRRLSSREYRNTIAAIFDLPNFQLPNNFPPDSTAHGFDNQGENLMIAGSHLEAIADTATAIADSFFLPPPPAPDQREVIALPNDLTISYSSACLIDGTMRLASSGSNLRRNATWPSRFIAPATGKIPARNHSCRLTQCFASCGT